MTIKRVRLPNPTSRHFPGDDKDRLSIRDRLPDGSFAVLEVTSPGCETKAELDAWAAEMRPRVEAAWRALAGGDE